jgi:hypothetical protein
VAVAVAVIAATVAEDDVATVALVAVTVTDAVPVVASMRIDAW